MAISLVGRTDGSNEGLCKVIHRFDSGIAALVKRPKEKEDIGMSELSKKTIKELEVICKDLGLTYYVGKKHITKVQMIEKIKSANIVESVEQKEINTQEVVKEENLAKVFSGEEKKQNKIAFVEKAEIGTLVAFIDERGKARTAELVNRSSSRQVVKVKTEYDREFIVPFDKVIWVRKPGNKRWPKGVYNMLKGISEDASKEVVK